MPLKKVQERNHNDSNRFDQFYEAQIKFAGNKQQNIKKELDNRDRAINDLMKNNYTLMSSGSRKILSRSGRRHDSVSNTVKIDANYHTNHFIKTNSVDYNSTSTFENNTGTIHEKLFQDKSLRDEKRRNLIETYKRDEIQKIKSKSRDKIGAKSELLRISRSANNLCEGMKNMQQSSQAAGPDTVSTLSKNYSTTNFIAKEVSNKLYQDAKRRQTTTSKSRGKDRSQSRNPRSNKYLKDLFENDFKKAIITVNKNIKSKKLNYFYT
jgi:hypothetical protein